MLRFRNFPLAEKFMDKRRGGASIKFFRGKTLSHSGKRFRRRGGYQDFRSNNFCIAAECFHRGFL